MYRILIPVDDNVDRASQQADYVTRLPSAKSGISVVLGHSFLAEDREAPDPMHRINRVETVTTSTKILEEAGIETNAIELSSPPRDGILSAIADQDIDEIVMSGKKRSPAEKAILGSVTQSVILNATIPVTVVNTP